MNYVKLSLGECKSLTLVDLWQCDLSHSHSDQVFVSVQLNEHHNFALTVNCPTSLGAVSESHILLI